jgi:hypothetical protein
MNKPVSVLREMARNRRRRLVFHLDAESITEMPMPPDGQMDVLVFRQKMLGKVPQARRVAVVPREAGGVQVSVEIGWHVFPREMVADAFKPAVVEPIRFVAGLEVTGNERSAPAMSWYRQVVDRFNDEVFHFPGSNGSYATCPSPSIPDHLEPCLIAVHTTRQCTTDRGQTFKDSLCRRFSERRQHVVGRSVDQSQVIPDAYQNHTMAGLRNSMSLGLNHEVIEMNALEQMASW